MKKLYIVVRNLCNHPFLTGDVVLRKAGSFDDEAEEGYQGFCSYDSADCYAQDDESNIAYMYKEEYIELDREACIMAEKAQQARLELLHYVENVLIRSTATLH